MVNKPNPFHKEDEVLKRAADFIKQFKDQDTPFKNEYERLLKDYKKLFKQTKFLVKMNDRQQNQLTTRTEGLQSSNVELQHKAKEAEKAVLATEKKLAQFLEAVSIGVFVIDANGHLYYANHKAKEILGKSIVPSSSSLEELSAVYQAYLAGTTQLYPTENQPIVQALQGKVSSVDDIEIHRGTKIIPIEVWGTPIFDEPGNVVYAIAVFQDITERKQAEAERLRFTETLAKLNKAYERFVPYQFLNLLDKKSVIDIHLGDQVEKEMTILFSDIRGFTPISEKMPPQENFNFINAYLSRMEPIIHEHHGMIDKYIGDAIMALFPNNADDAVQAAINMLKNLANYNLPKILKQSPLNIGIGIHTGQLMLGIIGGENRMDGTVISDAVNLASRIEDLTKIYGTNLLISEHTYTKLEDPSQYNIRVIDATKVKGKSETITVYEVFDADTPESIALKNETIMDFEPGFVLYHSDEVADAKPLFETVLRVNPYDTVAQVYLERCQNILSMTMPKMSVILVVDDTLFNIKVLTNLLCKHNFKVLVAKSGKAALEVVKHTLPHLILLDILMPGMDGFEVCRRLKSDPNCQYIPIIFTTALSDTEDKVKGLGLGAVDYITKPFQLEEVLARVKTHLHLSHLQQRATWCINKIGKI
jgi:class 3 adenylate cyclase/CheY-like chemotaxis protein/PAS domain-containing protein